MKKIFLLVALLPLVASCVAAGGSGATGQTTVSGTSAQTTTASFGRYCRFYGQRQCSLPISQPKGSKCFCKGSYGPVDGGIVE